MNFFPFNNLLLLNFDELEEMNTDILNNGK